VGQSYSDDLARVLSPATSLKIFAARAVPDLSKQAPGCEQPDPLAGPAFRPSGTKLPRWLPLVERTSIPPPCKGIPRVKRETVGNLARLLGFEPPTPRLRSVPQAPVPHSDQVPPSDT